MYIYVYACSDKKRMPTRSRVPDGSKKNADDEGEVDEDDEDGDDTSDQWDDDDDCEIVAKKVMKKVDNDKEEVVVAARVVEWAVRNVVADEGKDVVMNGGEGEAAVVNDGGDDVVPPVGNERDDGCDDGYHGCVIKNSLMRLKGGSLVDVHMHTVEAGILLEDHDAMRVLMDHQREKLIKMGGWVNTHVGAMKYNMSMVKQKIENMRVANAEDDVDDEYEDKMALQSDLCLAESNRKHMEAVKGIMDTIIFEQDELRTYVSEMAQDMRELHTMLGISQE